MGKTNKSTTLCSIAETANKCILTGLVWFVSFVPTSKTIRAAILCIPIGFLNGSSVAPTLETHWGSTFLHIRIVQRLMQNASIYYFLAVYVRNKMLSSFLLFILGYFLHGRYTNINQYWNLNIIGGFFRLVHQIWLWLRRIGVFSAAVVFFRSF